MQKNWHTISLSRVFADTKSNPFKQTIFRKDIFSNRYLVGAVAVAFLLLTGALYLSPLQKLLSTQPLGITEWLIIFGISTIEILLIEFSNPLAEFHGFSRG